MSVGAGDPVSVTITDVTNANAKGSHSISVGTSADKAGHATVTLS